MQTLRTPDARFDNLSGYDFAPHYADIKAADGTALRVHYLDAGPLDGDIILCMHGQPSWSYLYRKMIPLLTKAGYRVLAPDLIGFGRSDKPTEREVYTYQNHVDWMGQWVTGLGVSGLTLMCQDWGGLIGLRVVADHPDLFKRLVIANTGLPDSSRVTDDLSNFMQEMFDSIPVPDAATVREQFQSGAPGAFMYWVKYADQCPEFSVRAVFELLSQIKDKAVLDGYAAPFPDDSYIAGARQFPTLVPLLPRGKPDRLANDKAWKVLEGLDIPVLTAFSDSDPVTRGGEQAFMARLKHVKNVTIKGGGHFLQEDSPEALSAEIITFMQEN